MFVAAGAFIAVAYNLELFGGRFHGTLWFALGWGALPVLATYFAAAGDDRRRSRRSPPCSRRSSAGCSESSRRPFASQRRQEGALTAVGMEAERALRLLSAAMVALAAALVLLRVT